MTTFGSFLPDDAAEIHRRVLGVHYSQKPVDNTRDATILNGFYYVIMLADLPVAVDPYTGYTQAYGKVVRYVQPNNNTLDMEDATRNDSKLLVTNRYPTFSAVEGDLVLIARNGSEWTPINAAASSGARHAKVIECLGGGYYRGEFVDMIFTLPIDWTPGTAISTATGTGTDSSPCDDCDNVTRGAAGECDTVVQPTRESGTGTGTAIFMYDPRPTPLKIPGHVMVMDLGDTVDATAEGVLTGTGTGTSGDNPTIWMVMNGTYPVIGIPDRFYECCDDGTVLLIRCDRYIVEGVYCMGTPTACPVTTGTGTP